MELSMILSESLHANTSILSWGLDWNFYFQKIKIKIPNPHIILLDRPRTDCALAVGRDEISQLHDEVFAMTEKLILESKLKSEIRFKKDLSKIW